MKDNLENVVNILNAHHKHFFEGQHYADVTQQPTPEDSRAWSQILISALMEINGLARHKGQDLSDGSDVKSANAWGSIDKVRFNGVIKAGTKSVLSDSMAYLDEMPYLFFVLWDKDPEFNTERARVWVVRTQSDVAFRKMSKKWYELRNNGTIVSTNFQLHPPINSNSDVFTNKCGNLIYPLLLSAEWNGNTYIINEYNPDNLFHGNCQYTEE